ncbi:MAG: M23 family metallopeptidase [Kiritimatiellia bacterium]
MLRFWRNWWWLVAILVADVIFAVWWFGPRRERIRLDRELAAAAQIAVAADAEADQVEPAEQPLFVGFPTAQTGLLRMEDPSVYMATASGRIESAHYGSTRTRSFQGRILPAFHMGIDIAPLQRDRRNRALDPVLAVADGRVGYANRVVGHSNYGLYVVLEHDTTMGTIYSLYAHLRSIQDAIRPGAVVKRGDVLGVMGNTPSAIIPVDRSHVHFEVGVIRNRRFPAWADQEEIRNLHGMHNGWNLTGIQPLALYSNADSVQPFFMHAYLASVPVAFELVVDAERPIDYFVRYPLLWVGDGAPRGAVVLSVCEGGVVLRGRSAAEEEWIGKRLPYVLHADADVLGRNGLRLVVLRDAVWQIGNNGTRWLSILLH